MSRLDAATRDSIPPAEFAFPQQRKLPLEEAAHIRNAVARVG